MRGGLTLSLVKGERRQERKEAALFIERVSRPRWRWAAVVLAWTTGKGKGEGRGGMGQGEIEEA
jgi:hypothetical protein